MRRSAIWPLLIFAAVVATRASGQTVPADTTAVSGTASPDSASADPLYREIRNTAFRAGEYLKFVVRFGPIRAGFAYMEIPEMVDYQGRRCYRAVSRAESNDFFSTFYKVRDRAISIIDSAGIFSWRFEKSLREGKYKADVVEIFDQRRHVVITRKDTVEVPPFTQDVLSALYYVRTQPLKVGETIAVPTFSDGKKYPLEVHVWKKERVRVKAGKFNCFVVEPMLKSTGIFKHKGRITVWLTDDSHRMPVLMKTEILVGSIVAELIEFRNVYLVSTENGKPAAQQANSR